MKIGIVGTGNVGATLGRRFAAAGHEIVYAVRDASDPKVGTLLAGHPGRARAASLPVAAASSDLILLAVPFGAVAEAVEALGPLAGKIVVDATNPILPNLGGLSVGRDDSAGETVARLAPAAKVVKAFNTIGAAVMADPAFGGRPALLTVCGDDDAAKGAVIGLAKEIGFDAIDFGPLKNARYAEPLAMVWITLAYPLGRGPGFALTLAAR